MISRFRERLENLVRRLFFAYEVYSRHELSNHAAAGAYSFLLSATPAFLVIFYVSAILLGQSPETVKQVSGFLVQFLGEQGSASIVKGFFSKPLSGMAGLFCIANLIWAARLFVVSLQKGIKIVWAQEGKNTPVRENLVMFASELIAIVIVVIVIIFNQVGGILIELGKTSQIIPKAFETIMQYCILLLPIAAFFSFVFLSIQYFPPTRPKKRTAFIASASCIVSFQVIQYVLGLFVNTARYNLLYGFIGNLVVSLISVYLFFNLYFFFAALVYVMDRYDAMLFSRFYRVTKSGGLGVNALEKGLFMAPDSLFRNYAKRLAQKERVFSEGDTSQTAYYLYQGEIGIYLASQGSEQRVATIKPGEFFGEMAHLLDEPRTASTIAEQQSTVFALPPELFERFLGSDAEAAKRMINLLSERLKESNRHLSRVKASVEARIPEKIEPKPRARRKKGS